MRKRTILFLLSGLIVPVTLVSVAGALSTSQAVDAATVTPTVLCKEYGDSGIDIYHVASIFEVIPKTSTKPAQENYMGSDVCIDATRLREYYCYTIGVADLKPYGYVQGNMLARQTEVSCKNGCYKGACKAEPVVTVPTTPAAETPADTTTVAKPPVTPTQTPTNTNTSVNTNTNTSVKIPPVKQTTKPAPANKSTVKRVTGGACNANSMCASGRCLSGKCAWTRSCANRMCTQ